MNIFHMRVHEYTPAAEGSGKIKLPARSAGPKMYVTRAKRELIYVYFYMNYVHMFVRNHNIMSEFHNGFVCTLLLICMKYRTSQSKPHEYM